jgi:hypothetical protein
MPAPSRRSEWPSDDPGQPEKALWWREKTELASRQEGATRLSDDCRAGEPGQTSDRRERVTSRDGHVT